MGDLGIADVWAVNDGEKVKRDDLANPNRAQNSVWDGQKVSLFGARNEILGFQVIVQAGPNGAKEVDVRLEELVHRESGTRLVFRPETDDPTDTRDRQIERFTQHYLHIAKPSPPGWFYNRDAAPPDPTGWIPDPLVPCNAKRGQGGAPFDIGPNQNQGVWFDIAIPKENMPAGIYEGTIRISEGGQVAKEIPVSLRVFDFVLPDETHFDAMIYFDEAQVATRHGTPDRALVARYHRFAHRHRVEFTHTYRPNTGQEQCDRITGEAFTPGRGYVGPGEGVGYSILPASFYGMGPEWSEDRAHATADAFMTWLNGIKPNAITFLYITDEPPPDRLPWIRSIGQLHHANPGPGRNLPMFITHAPHPELEGAIDIWCTVTNQYDIARAKAEKAKGRRWWVYNGHRPAAGTGLTEAPAVDLRVTPWACWKYGVELWFYWFANHWRHNSQAPRGEQNVWVDPVTFGHDGEYNGDGVLIYAGQDAVFPDQDRGIAGPIASIRLKNIRRGIQDYEYLWLAEQNELQAEARVVADACVPAAFSEAKGDVAWSQRGSDWDAQRLKLAEQLEQRLNAVKP
ncbi:MAG TPA: glycoside hydrolase domain-containing protein [Chthonomonadaceae bacterium]|nr:glycoside hydrolase domain-containing protein [Chthonomonadaceae bacterium]